MLNLSLPLHLLCLCLKLLTVSFCSLIFKFYMAPIKLIWVSASSSVCKLLSEQLLSVLPSASPFSHSPLPLCTHFSCTYTVSESINLFNLLSHSRRQVDIIFIFQINKCSSRRLIELNKITECPHGRASISAEACLTLKLVVLLPQQPSTLNISGHFNFLRMDTMPFFVFAYLGYV